MLILSRRENIFIFYPNNPFKTKYLNSEKKKKWSYIMKNRKLYNTIISSIWCLCENSILYKFQVTRVFFQFCFQAKYQRIHRNLDKNKSTLAYRVHLNFFFIEIWYIIFGIFMHRFCHLTVKKMYFINIHFTAENSIYTVKTLTHPQHRG